LYNRLFEQKPSLNKKEQKLLRVLPNGNKDNAHLFGFILIIMLVLVFILFVGLVVYFVADTIIETKNNEKL
jgi:membrane protein insertase Oxa1/YidC/SpoIIIJ